MKFREWLFSQTEHRASLRCPWLPSPSTEVAVAVDCLANHVHHSRVCYLHCFSSAADRIEGSCAYDRTVLDNSDESISTDPIRSRFKLCRNSCCRLYNPRRPIRKLETVDNRKCRTMRNERQTHRTYGERERTQTADAVFLHKRTRSDVGPGYVYHCT